MSSSMFVQVCKSCVSARGWVYAYMCMYTASEWAECRGEGYWQVVKACMQPEPLPVCMCVEGSGPSGPDWIGAEQVDMITIIEGLGCGWRPLQQQSGLPVSATLHWLVEPRCQGRYQIAHIKCMQLNARALLNMHVHTCQQITSLWWCPFPAGCAV